MANAGESLAGRVAILELLPLGVGELPESERSDAERAIWLGGDPEPRLRPEVRDLWMRSYVRTYVERDVRQLHNVQDLRAFETDFRLALCQPPRAALAGAMGGALFEGLVVAEAVKAFTHAGRTPELFFWRSREGLEVDLLLPLGGELVPVEIKSTATPTGRHALPLDRFRRAAGEAAAKQGLLVCRVAEPRPLPGGHLALPWWRLPGWIAERLGG